MVCCHYGQARYEQQQRRLPERRPRHMKRWRSLALMAELALAGVSEQQRLPYGAALRRRGTARAQPRATICVHASARRDKR